MIITTSDFALEWEHGDGIKHKADYDDLIKAYEQSRWISVKERMPEEHDSIFKKIKGTIRWEKGMFEKTSRKVIVAIRINDGSYVVDTATTLDGRWKAHGFMNSSDEIIAWMPMPDPSHVCEENSNDQMDASDIPGIMS